MPDLSAKHLEVFAFDPHGANPDEIAAMAKELIRHRAAGFVTRAAIEGVQSAHEQQLTRIARDRAKEGRKLARQKDALDRVAALAQPPFGGEYEHTDCAEAACPACWVADIRRAITPKEGTE